MSLEKCEKQIILGKKQYRKNKIDTHRTHIRSRSLSLINSD